MIRTLTKPSAAAPSEASDILIISSAPPGGSPLLDMLKKCGFSARCVSGLVDVLKAAKFFAPQAVILDTEHPGVDMGADHVIRMLRLTHPNLSIIALFDAPSRKARSVAAEFGISTVFRPLAARELTTALQRCGIQSGVGAACTA
jgi:DNA-binding response OmpR family regulator